MSSGKTNLMWFIQQELKFEKGEISKEEFDEIMARSNEKRDKPIFIYPRY